MGGFVRGAIFNIQLDLFPLLLSFAYYSEVKTVYPKMLGGLKLRKKILINSADGYDENRS
jgi:hypothetical protein